MQALRHMSSPGGPRVPHVAVVGAGFAGLRCSAVLARAGVKVTLFEARRRIGGRVHQVLSGGHLMDMGANWIHGTEGNPIMALAAQTRSRTMEPPKENAVFDTTGTRRPDSEARQLSGQIWEMVMEAFKYSDAQTASLDEQQSLFDYFQRQLSEADVDDATRNDLLQEAHMWGPFVGDSVKTQSLKFFFLDQCLDGGNVFLASTYKRILDHIGKPVTENPSIDVHFDTEIVHVDSRNGAQPPTPARRVTITTASGERHHFDDVVVTSPLGWLKRNHGTTFAPALPPRLVSAISNINYGRLEKLYVTFPSAFWLKDGPGDQRGDVSNYPTFTHFHDPSYVAHLDGETWNQSVFSLAHLPSPDAHPTLLFYVYGACATHVVDSITGLEEHSDRYNAALSAFAEPFYSRLPHYAPGDAACQPTSFLMTQWQADRFAGNGSYCNFQIGLTHADEDIEVLRDAGGLTRQGVWLAGEHTAPFIALGTTTGAWWSGEAVAARICKEYGLTVGEDGPLMDGDDTPGPDTSPKS